METALPTPVVAPFSRPIYVFMEGSLAVDVQDEVGKWKVSRVIC